MTEKSTDRHDGNFKMFFVAESAKLGYIYIWSPLGHYAQHKSSPSPSSSALPSLWNTF